MTLLGSASCFYLLRGSWPIGLALLACSGCADSEPKSARTPLSRVVAAPRIPGSGSAATRRHVIVVVGDGMQLAHEVAASRYLFGNDDGLSFHEFPVRAFVTTWDVTGYNQRATATGSPPYDPRSFEPTLGYDPALGGEAPYPLLADTPERRNYFLTGPSPDSASTATAMSTGHKTDYNNIAWMTGDPANGALEASPKHLKDHYGMANGLVTTVPISHATPACWFAHDVDRWNYLPIGKELLLETRPDVILGGGVGVDRGNFIDAADLTQALASDRWTFVERSAGVDGNQAVSKAARTALDGERGLIGIFGGSAGNWESPVARDQPSSPDVVRGNREDPSLAEASVAALEVLSRDPDGFFLLVEQGDIDWANHANDFARMIGCVSDLHEAVRSIVAFVDRPGDPIDWSNTTVLVTADHANSYMRLDKPLSRGDLPAQVGTSGAFTYPEGEVSYGTTGHTGELVTLSARGFAADKVASYQTAYPGLPIVDNTAIYQLTLDAARR